MWRISLRIVNRSTKKVHKLAKSIQLCRFYFLRIAPVIGQMSHLFSNRRREIWPLEQENKEKATPNEIAMRPAEERPYAQVAMGKELPTSALPPSSTVEESKSSAEEDSPSVLQETQPDLTAAGDNQQSQGGNFAADKFEEDAPEVESMSRATRARLRSVQMVPADYKTRPFRPAGSEFEKLREPEEADFPARLRRKKKTLGEIAIMNSASKVGRRARSDTTPIEPAHPKAKEGQTEEKQEAELIQQAIRELEGPRATTPPTTADIASPPSPNLDKAEEIEVAATSNRAPSPATSTIEANEVSLTETSLVENQQHEGPAPIDRFAQLEAMMQQVLATTTALAAKVEATNPILRTPSPTPPLSQPNFTAATGVSASTASPTGSVPTGTLVTTVSPPRSATATPRVAMPINSTICLPEIRPDEAQEHMRRFQQAWADLQSRGIMPCLPGTPFAFGTTPPGY